MKIILNEDKEKELEAWRYAKAKQIADSMQADGIDSEVIEDAILKYIIAEDRKNQADKAKTAGVAKKILIALGIAGTAAGGALAYSKLKDKSNDYYDDDDDIFGEMHDSDYDDLTRQLVDWRRKEIAAQREFDAKVSNDLDREMETID